jgi:hypothetical protein
VILPIVHENPGSKFAQGKIADKLMEISNVREDSILSRAWCAFCADAGAVDLTRLFGNEYEGMMYMTAWGHFDMACCRLMLRIALGLSGHAFCTAFGFSESSNSAHNYLMSGKDFHYAYDYLSLLLSSFNEEFYKLWLLSENPTNHQDIVSYRAWLLDDNGDKMWKNYVYFYTNILPQFFLVRVGMRERNYYKANAARRGLMSYFFKLGFPIYSKVSLWEMMRTDYCCKKEVKQFITNHFAYRGQGFDFDQEEKIQGIMNERTRQGPAGYDAANLILAEKSGNREHVYGLLNFQVRPSDKRVEIDRSKDKNNFAQILLKHNVLAKMPGRRVTTSVDGKIVFCCGKSLEDINNEGKSEMKLAIQKGLIDYKSPKAVNLYCYKEANSNTVAIDFNNNGNEVYTEDIGSNNINNV